MNYISTKAAAEKWNITGRRVVKLAGQGRIPGAVYIGNCWMIPENAQKPTDGRTKSSKDTEIQSDFRFPFLLYTQKNAINQPLTDEEVLLQKAQSDFYACNFERAKLVFSDLYNKTSSIYIRIRALYYMCIIPAVYKPDPEWEHYYRSFHLCFLNDFAYKKEMELMIPALDALLGMYLSAAKEYKFDHEYNYHSSVLYIIANLSALCMIREGVGNIKSANLDSYEILCRNMEQDGYFFEAEDMHLALFYVNLLLNKYNLMQNHLRKALKLAQENNNIFSIINYYPYYQDVFNDVLKEFPDDFSEKIRICGKQMEARYASFSHEYNISEMFEFTSKNDYKLIMYASYGYSYKQVADIMNISERAVANKYSRLFTKLNVSNKHELCLLLTNAWTKKF